MFVESLSFGFCFLSSKEIESLSAQAHILAESESGDSMHIAKKRVDSDGAAAPPEILLRLDTGALPLSTLDVLLKTLPVDMTFVDAEGRVEWFANGSHRIFPRSPSVIGRDVRNCHPKESVDKVVAILNDFKTGKRDHEAFWIRMKDRFIHIEYSALRDSNGQYLGTLEVSQDLTEKRALEGEKRLSGEI